jgi:phosphatidylserine/phosphatidylglycerophosphate/cardiolipin synthase-like enzyme
MADLWKVIAEMCTELHPDRIAAIATGIESLPSNEFASNAKERFGVGVENQHYLRLKSAWNENSEYSSKEVAAALLGATATAQHLSAIGITELVWTGPTTGIVPVRRTEQVICEVVESAFVELFIVCFVAYKAETVIRSLQAAQERGVRISILLESDQEHGGSLDFNSIRHLRRNLPTAEFYCWKQGSAESKGAVHAKCAVADGKTAFVTSANLTGAAMDRNMEVGVLVKGGKLPFQLINHLNELVKRRIIEPN